MKLAAFKVGAGRVKWVAFPAVSLVLVTVAFLALRSPAPARMRAAPSLIHESPVELAPSPAVIRHPAGTIHSRKAPPTIEPREPPIDFAAASFEDLEQRLSHEAVNAEWSENAATFIRGALDVEDAGVKTAVSLRCGQSVCRATLSGRDVGTLVGLATASRSAGISSRYHRVPSDGGYVVVVYFGRTPSEAPTIAP